MKQLIVDSAEVFVVGPDVPRYKLAADMGEVYETLTLLKLKTQCGQEGFSGVTTYSEHCYEESLGVALKPLLKGLMGQNARETKKIWHYLMGRYNSMTPKPQSAIDIALWDLNAKVCGLPLYQMLGGDRNRIRSYASTPLLDSPQDYVAYVRNLLDQGFDTVKFHVWCELKQDLALLSAIDEAFGQELAFMVDLEERYNREDALIIARQLETMNCVWLEAPLVDTDLEGYSELKRKTSVPIISAGNTLLSPGMMEPALKQNAWDAVRTDVTYAGGITPAIEIAELARKYQLPLELQSWGYTPAQAANLHMMLSISHACYFEQAVPYDSHEACCQTPIRTRAGHVQAPEGAGLGIEMDWWSVKEQSICHYRIES